jgi:SAM-dependent methyltransferase
VCTSMNNFSDTNKRILTRITSYDFLYVSFLEQSSWVFLSSQPCRRWHWWEDGSASALWGSPPSLVLSPAFPYAVPLLLQMRLLPCYRMSCGIANLRSPEKTFAGLTRRPPRLVYHIDDAAVAATERFYTSLFTQIAGQKQAPLDVLDLCSSWVSHYPRDNRASDPPVQLRRIAGLGMNAEELAANTRLTEYVVCDLNKQPVLPYADASFDAVTCTVSIDYLTKPLDVCREAARVLRPGGQIAFVFSDRLFFSKAVALWTGKDDLEHVYTVGAYMHYGAGTLLSDIRAIDLVPSSKRQGKRRGDPLYAVLGTRSAS